MTEADTTLVPERLHDLAPGRKLVWVAIHRDPPVQIDDLVSHTGLSAVSVRRAASELEARGEIAVLPVAGDARRRRYEPAPTPR